MDDTGHLARCVLNANDQVPIFCGLFFCDETDERDPFFVTFFFYPRNRHKICQFLPVPQQAAYYLKAITKIISEILNRFFLRLLIIREDYVY